LKYKFTPGISNLAKILIHPNRFSQASFLNYERGIWDPVRMIVLDIFFVRKDKIEPVYSSESVP